MEDPEKFASLHCLIRKLFDVEMMRAHQSYTDQNISHQSQRVFICEILFCACDAMGLSMLIGHRQEMLIYYLHTGTECPQVHLISKFIRILDVEQL